MGSKMEHPRFPFFDNFFEWRKCDFVIKTNGFLMILPFAGDPFHKDGRPFLMLFSDIDFLMHFGRPLAPFGRPFGSLWAPFGFLLAPFGVILAPFDALIGPSWRPLAHCWILLAVRWLTFVHF